MTPEQRRARATSNVLLAAAWALLLSIAAPLLVGVAVFFVVLLILT